MPTVLVLLSGGGGGVVWNFTVLLRVTSPVPGGFSCTRLKRLSGAQASQCWFSRFTADWMAIAILCMAAVGFCLFFPGIIFSKMTMGQYSYLEIDQN